jgi:hypothetical protein
MQHNKAVIRFPFDFARGRITAFNFLSIAYLGVPHFPGDVGVSVAHLFYYLLTIAY